MKKRSLEKLVEEAASEYEVPENLLLEILSLERARIYLFETKRTSVLKTIRVMIQAEVNQ